MADFMLLFRDCHDPKATPAAAQDQMEKWIAWMKALGQRGQLKGGDPLEETGKVVRGRDRLVTDGPFAEAKDLVGGYLIVSARDLHEASEMAKGCPGLDVGGNVEVRPVRLMEP